MAPRLQKPGQKVVPVIPLPWVQHHEAKLAARKTREKPESPISKVDDEPADDEQQQPEQVTNAAEQPKEDDPVEDTASSDSTPSATEAPVESEPQTVMPTPTSAAPSLPAGTPEKPSATVNGDQAEGSESDAQASSFGQEPSNGWSDINRNIKDIRRADHAEAPAKPNAPEYRPHAPAFRPAQQNPPPGFENTGDMNRGHYQHVPNGINGHSMHHAHPSSASAAHFSTFSSSSAASPTPPHSGGMMPPPGMHLNGAQPPFLPSAANNYHNMSYGPEVMSGNGINGSEHPNVGYVAPQSAHSYGHGQDTTSQSFQEQHGVRHQQQLANGPSDADLADYTRQMFTNPSFVDALLELRYKDGRPPIHLPGHRFIFSRSPVLSDLISRVDNHGGRRPITIDIDSKWIRSDSLWMVLQTLYGHPLLPVPHHAGGTAQAGSSNEQLDFALSYAAAGQLLGWAPAMRRGAEIAGELVNFDNVDRVLEFALEGYTDFGTHEVYKHQLGAEIVLAGVANFIANNLTPSFNIDDTSSQHLRYSRLPIKPQPKSSKSEASAPAIEEFNGESPLARGHRRQLSSIKFGDMSGLDGQAGMSTPKASHAHPAHQAALSRALLNIPFGFLRMTLDIFGARLAAHRGFIEPQHAIVQRILDARESERSRSIESLLGDGNQSRMNVVSMLRAPQPSNSDQWGILGWEESVSAALPAANGALGLQIQREWRPLWIPQHENEVAEFP